MYPRNKPHFKEKNTIIHEDQSRKKPESCTISPTFLSLN